MSRILSIDYGTVRIGLAISDPTGKVALPLSTLQAGKEEKNSAEIVFSYLQEKGLCLSQILIGFPLHLNGRESPMSQKVCLFAKELKKLFSCPIELVDERLSSSFMENSFKKLSYNRKKRAQKIDEASACLFLQEYLEKIITF